MAERTLKDVASLLPREAAASLADKPPVFQQVVIAEVGRCLDYVEQRGIEMDPIALEAVLNTWVLLSASHYTASEQLATRYVHHMDVCPNPNAGAP